MQPRSRTSRNAKQRPLLERLDRLCRLAGDVAALQGEEATLRRIVSTAVGVVGVPAAHIALVDRGHTTLYGMVSSGRHRREAPRVRFELHRGMGAVTALRRRRTVVIRDATRDPRVNEAARARLHIGSVAYVPLLASGASFGLLILTTPRPHAWTREQTRLAGYVAGVASVAIQTSRLLERLAQAEGRFRHLLEDVPAISYTSDVEWPYRSHYVSPQAGALLGYPAEEWIRDPGLFVRMVHPDDVAKIIKEADEAVRGRGFVRTEYRILDRDGNVRWFRDEAMLVRDPAGRPVAWHGVLIEVGRYRDKGVAPAAGPLDRPEKHDPPRPEAG